MSFSKEILLTDLPESGLVWLPVPVGTAWRRTVLVDGGELPSQFIPSPFIHADWEGLILARIPFGEDKSVRIRLESAVDSSVGMDKTDTQESLPFVSLKEGVLHLLLPGFSCRLNDHLINRQAVDDRHRSLQNNPLLLSKGNSYPFHDENAHIETISCGPVADIVRITAVPIRQENSRPLPGVTMYYDVALFHDLPLVQIISCFQTDDDNLQVATRIGFGELVLERTPFDHWVCGEPSWGGTLIPDEEGKLPTISALADGERALTAGHYFALCGKEAAIAVIGGNVDFHFAGTNDDFPNTYILSACPDNSIHVLSDFGPAFPISMNLLYGEAARDPKRWLGNTPRIIRLSAEECGCTDGRRAAGCQTILAGALRVTLACGRDGITLRDVYDQKMDRYLLKDGYCGLFDLSLREVCAQGVMSPDIRDCRQLILSSTKGWQHVAIVGDENECQLVFLDAVQAPGISVTIHAAADSTRDRISWTCSIANESLKYTVLQMDYPRLNFDASGELNLFYPTGSGEVWENITDMTIMNYMQYCCWKCAMQYYALWDRKTRRGLYYGTHDGQPNKKYLFAEKEAAGRRGRIGITFPAVGIGEKKNGQQLPGQLIWQLFDGDWYDAAQIYRDFVTQNATWIPQLENGRRKDVPDWLYNTAVWCTQNVSDGDTEDTAWADEAVSLQKRLGVPMAVHLYQWHKIQFDTCYPHYFPAKPNTLPGVQKLRAANIPFMPYTNGRLWDIDDGESPEYTGVPLENSFEKVGRYGATKNVLGEVIGETYSLQFCHKNGERVYLNTMCPSSAVWQETVVDFSEKIFREIGANAVYLDQLSCSEPPLCFDPDHPHRPGGGSWYADANYQMLDHLKRIKPVYGAFASEDNAEFYMKALQGYLIWHWVRGGQVPAFSAVYSGYIPMFGRCYDNRKNPEGELARRIILADQMCAGDQLGWAFYTFYDEAYADSDEFRLIRDCAQLRYRFREYFNHGQLLRPPEAACNGDLIIALDGGMEGNRYYSVKPVSAACRTGVGGQGRLLILINISEEAQETALSCIDIPDGRVTWHGGLCGGAKIKDGALHVVLPAQSVSIGEYEG